MKAGRFEITPYSVKSEKVDYNVLWQLYREGRLAPQSNPWKDADGTRMLANMYIED